MDKTLKEAEDFLKGKGIYPEDFISSSTYIAICVVVRRLLSDKAELEDELKVVRESEDDNREG